MSRRRVLAVLTVLTLAVIAFAGTRVIAANKANLHATCVTGNGQREAPADQRQVRPAEFPL
jgi:hypothetical protein